MNLVAKLGLFATTLFIVVSVRAQLTVNLAKLLYLAPVKSRVERQDFRNQLEKSDILGWLTSIEEFALDARNTNTDAKFKMATALEFVAARAAQVPLAERSLANPTSSVTVIEFFLSMVGPTAINAPVFKHFSIIQLGQECYLAATLATSADFVDEREMCAKRVFPIVVDLSKRPSLLISTSAKKVLAMLAAVYPTPALSARSIAENDRRAAIADFRKRAGDALDSLVDYQNTVDRR